MGSGARGGALPRLLLLLALAALPGAAPGTCPGCKGCMPACGVRARVRGVQGVHARGACPGAGGAQYPHPRVLRGAGGVGVRMLPPTASLWLLQASSVQGGRILPPPEWGGGAQPAPGEEGGVYGELPAPPVSGVAGRHLRCSGLPGWGSPGGQGGGSSSPGRCFGDGRGAVGCPAQTGPGGGSTPAPLATLPDAASFPVSPPASERPRSAAEAWVGGRQGPHQAPGTGGSWQRPPGDAPGVEGNPVPAAAPEAKASRQQAPADLGLPEAAHPVPRGPAEISGAGNSSRPCPGCAEGTGDPGARPPQPLSARDNEEALEASAAVTSVAWPADGEAIVLDLNATKGALESTAPAPESPEEPGSGDPAGRASAPTQRPTTGTTRPSTTPGLSSDSAETDLLLEAAGDAGPGSPPPGARTPGLAPGSAQKEESLELWLELASSSPAQGALGHTDVTWLPTEAPPSATDDPAGLKTPEPPSEQTASEIIDIDYYDLFDGDSHGGAEGLDDFAAGGPGAAKKPGDKASSWSLHELYDDFTPFDESDFYPTTSFYTDGDEEGEDDELDEPEEDEEEDEEEDGGAGLARDLEDENGRAAPTPAVPKTLAAEPTSRRFVVPPLQTFVVAGPGATARPHPSKDLSPASVAGENGTECRSGYVRHNNSCKSVCDIFPSYCHNGGQCYLVESLGAFCR